MTIETRTRLRCASVGFAVTAAMVAYQVITDSPGVDIGGWIVFGLGVFLCPPWVLFIPVFVALFEVAETGTPAFYFIWFLIAVLNAALYAGVGPSILRWVKRRGSSRRMKAT